MGGNTAGVASAAPLAEALPADFDKDQFRQVIQVKALKIPARQCQHYMKLLMPYVISPALSLISAATPACISHCHSRHSPYTTLCRHLLNKPRIRNVMDVEGEPEWRLLLLEEGLDHQGEILAHVFFPGTCTP